MSKRRLNGLAWTLLGLTAVLMAAGVPGRRGRRDRPVPVVRAGAAPVAQGVVYASAVSALVVFIVAAFSDNPLGVVDSAVQPAYLSVWTAGPRQGGGER